jgi:hypothetical protein
MPHVAPLERATRCAGVVATARGDRINGLTVSITFTYDPNGNGLAGNGRSTRWTSYNKPASITQGSSTISFLDGSDHRQFNAEWQETPCARLATTIRGELDSLEASGLCGKVVSKIDHTNILYQRMGVLHASNRISGRCNESGEAV